MAKSDPIGLQWRSHRTFIIATATVGIFIDTFLYCLIIPVMPFLLRDRLNMPDDQIQSKTAVFLAAFAIASVLFSVPAGWLADWTTTRRTPYLLGLVALAGSTLLLALGQTFWVLVLSRFLQGMSAAMVNTTAYAMVYDVVGSETLGTTLGTINGFAGVAWLGSAPIGGILYAIAGYGGVFGVSLAALGIDLVMRLLVIETKKKKPTSSLEDRGEGQDHSTAPVPRGEATESDALLPRERRKPSDEKWSLTKALPILRCLGDVRLLTCYLLELVASLIFGAFDATLTTEAIALFDFNSLQAGLLFFALSLPYFSLAPLAGKAVDRYGSRIVAMVGFGMFAPCLALLRLPELLNGTLERNENIALICVILALNGVSCAAANAFQLVEASAVVSEFVRADPGSFGEKGPYAQLFGMSWVIVNIGLAVGPLMGGWLREVIGFGNTFTIFGGMAGATVILSSFFLGKRNKKQNGLA